MKKIMKKALGVVLAVVMMLTLAPLSAYAAPAASPSGAGTGEDPYVITTDGTTYMLYVEANGVAFVSTGEAYNATINGVGSTGNYSFKRGMMDYEPVESDASGMASVTLEESNMVMVCNLDAENAITVYVQATADGGSTGVPTGTWQNPEEVVFTNNQWTGAYGANLNVELAAGAEGYYYRYTATEPGAVTVGVNASDVDWNPVGCMCYVNNVTAGVYGDYLYSDEYGYISTQTVAVNTGDVIEVFVNTYNPENMWGNPAGFVYTNFGFATVGSSDYPADVTVGTQSTTVAEGAGEYYYLYTATQAGTLTVSMDAGNANGWSYYLYNLTSYAQSDSHASGDDPVVETESMTVAAGDEVKISVTTFDAENPWTNPAGTVNWTLSFTPASSGGVGDEDVEIPGGDDEEEDVVVPGGDDEEEDVVVPGGDDEDEDVTDGDFIEPEENVNYVQSTALIYVGGNNLEVSDEYAYTIYAFEPTSTGAYTFTTNNSVMGIVSNNGMWVTTEPSTTTVNSNVIEWECTSVGQSIWIAVASDDAIASIDVTVLGLDIEEIPEYMYGVSSQPYVFTGNVADLMYVDVEDKTEDKAVLGKDGYYHLNTEDGPILLVNLYDDILALGKAPDTGKVIVVGYDPSGEVSYYINWNEALLTYRADADVATGLYPLTDALISIYQEYGKQQLWYTETGYVGGQLSLGNPADAWMFACYYVPNAEDGTMLVPPVVIKPDVAEDNVISKENFSAIVEFAVEQNKPVVIQTTNTGVTMTFSPEDLKDAAALDLNIEVNVVDDVKDETVAKNEVITEDNFVLKIEFSHDGPLPAQAAITITVAKEYAGQELYYYEIFEDGSLDYICSTVVDENGNAVVSQDHCSDYVLLTQPIGVTDDSTDDDSTNNGSTGDDSTNNGSTGDDSTNNGSTGDDSTNNGSTNDSTNNGSTDDSTNNGSTNDSTDNESADDSTNNESTDDSTDAEKPGKPVTGDSANLVLWIAVLGFAVVAVVASVVMKKREF